MEVMLYGLIAVLAALIIYVIGAYNRLVSLKHNVKTAWSNIDVLLQQRHEELPKLVETCKQHMAYEKETLERVIKARQMVARARQSGSLAALGTAEGLLGSSIGNLFAVAEDYPDLKASEGFQQLQNRISSLENSIADRREFFNHSVNQNNIAIDAFPTNMIAKKFVFIRRKPFKVADEKRKDVNMETLFG